MSLNLPAALKSRRAKRVHFWRGGKGHAIVLLQGGMADAGFHWSPVREELAKHYDVIAPDLPGFGRSQAISGANWKTLSKWLAGFLDQVNVDRAAIVGNSFGGSLARAFTNERASRVTHLVCVNGGQFIRLPTPVRLNLRTPLGAWMWKRRNRGGMNEAAIRNMFADPNFPTDEQVTRCIASSPALFAILRGCLANLPPANPPGAPMLILWGAEDRHTPLASAEALQGELPGSRLVTIPGAGHLPQLEQPSAFVAALREFLS
jgi:2-hydroxy-6-oxonona-2,4-dienedioate hydrolase